ncbi:MAG: 6-pyruvoyl trahydropterin synthase family protein [Pantoea agglomerans]
MNSEHLIADIGEFPVTAYRVSKLFDDLPCCHRSWANQGHCAFLHGYERRFNVEFCCFTLESGTGFIVDFSGLKKIRAALCHQFDHTTLIAENDPELPLFRQLAARNIIDLRIMANTSMEGAARWVFETANKLISEETEGRVWVTSVEARESRKNAVTLTSQQ